MQSSRSAHAELARELAQSSRRAHAELAQSSRRGNALQLRISCYPCVVEVRCGAVVIASDAGMLKFGYGCGSVAHVTEPLGRIDTCDAAAAGPIAIAWQSAARDHFCTLAWVKLRGSPVWVWVLGGDGGQRVFVRNYKPPPSLGTLMDAVLAKKKIATQKAKKTRMTFSGGNFQSTGRFRR